MVEVVLIGCETYDYNAVKKAVEKGIHLLGGPERFAHKGERILLKPNLLVPSRPERCVTTHPTVFKAVAEVLLTTGAILSYGDSPSLGSTARAAKNSGLMDAAEPLNMALADFKTGKEVYFEDGRQNRHFVIAKGVLECDGIVSLPKLKTHGLTRITGCVKNQFGCVPGFLKGEYHVKVPDATDFARMLVDLNRFVKPRLYIMDGICGMDGNGPRSGSLKKMKVLLFSADPIALDATVCRLIDLNPEYVPTTVLGKECGMGTYLEQEIELVGDDLDEFRDRTFDVVRAPVTPYTMKGIKRFAKNRLVSKPYIVEDKCSRCGTCITMCPANPKAVNWVDGDTSRVPVHSYANCIRCYCCQEVCPEGAIELNVPLARRFLSYFGR